MIDLALVVTFLIAGWAAVGAIVWLLVSIDRADTMSEEWTRDQKRENARRSA
jgi:hypothetical protein